MKFSNLNSIQRTLLAALATTQTAGLTTDRLARPHELGGCARTAAHHLCALRELGLVYSEAKKSSESYCNWRITAVGMALFEGRPDGDLGMHKPKDTAAPAQDKALNLKTYKVYRAGERDCVTKGLYATDDEAFVMLRNCAASEPGVEFILVTTVAHALLPKPTPTITRV